MNIANLENLEDATNHAHFDITNSGDVRIDAKGMHYKDLNDGIVAAIKGGAQRLTLDGVNGQRYIGAGVSAKAEIVINGVPGNDLAAFADGLRIVVHGNAQDAVANTMNDGELIIHGSTADILGYAMRGGRIFVKSDVGYRVGIHMKEYKDIKPIIVIGGKAGDFLGEYMAGGDLVLLGLDDCPERTADGKERVRPLTGDYVGTGMHGGRLFIRGEIEPHKLGKEVSRVGLTADDEAHLADLVCQFASYFGCDVDEVFKVGFSKYVPLNARPYGRMYAY